MAASCHKSEYLLISLQEMFILSGGPIEWLLVGLDAVEPKIKKLATFLEKLAFRPWIVKSEDIKDLVKSEECRLSINEVLKASVIFSTYLGLASISHGMGLEPDSDIVASLNKLVGQQIELLITARVLMKSGVKMG